MAEKILPTHGELLALIDTYADTAAVNGTRSPWAQMARGAVDVALREFIKSPEPVDLAPIGMSMFASKADYDAAIGAAK